jgi:radical SAM modification target selenobiotic family peptide
MNQKDFKKILAGFSITTLIAGATIVGFGYPEPAQAAWAGSKDSGGTGTVKESAAAGGNAERGKQLFADTKLGGSTNDKSCNTCHPGGKGLEKAGANLENTIQACIQKAMAGKPLAADSQELKDLLAYIKSLKK